MALFANHCELGVASRQQWRIVPSATLRPVAVAHLHDSSGRRWLWGPRLLKLLQIGHLRVVSMRGAGIDARPHHFEVEVGEGRLEPCDVSDLHTAERSGGGEPGVSGMDNLIGGESRNTRQVLAWGPDRGNPSLRRQGPRPEHRLVCVVTFVCDPTCAREGRSEGSHRCEPCPNESEAP
jgi:hypothetical protein